MIIPNYDPKKKGKDNTKEEVLHPFFKGISRLLLCAPSGGGKTNLLMHILLTPLIYYDEVIIYSKTIDQDKYVMLDELYNKIAKDNKIKSFHTFTDKEVESVESLDTKKRKIVIFDDLICAPPKEMKKIVDYFILGRHKKANCIFLTQSYYRTPKDIRINCSKFCIFGLPTRREIRSVLADHANLTEEMFRKNTLGHDFISIDRTAKTLSKNIDEELEH